jgi:hypothetical protein
MVNFQSNPTFFDLSYSQSSVGTIFSTTTGSTSVTSVPATPLPSTWLMMLSGLIGLGFVTQRAAKHRFVAFSAA